MNTSLFITTKGRVHLDRVRNRNRKYTMYVNICKQMLTMASVVSCCPKWPCTSLSVNVTNEQAQN